ncbi:MAG: LPS export ABC transporter periplasmic protein LptC [Acidobacteriota bacterium]|nr:LPS export ABC transporter periplasmic protein LptC [Acidobacteriota bacterium]
MQEIRRRKATAIGLRAGLPRVMRVLALALLVVGVVFAGWSYYRLRGNRPFRLIQKEAQLSSTVVGIVEGYERRVTKGDRVTLLLRAARDVTFSDGHHELEDVYLEVYPETGDRPNKISAQRTIATNISESEDSQITFTGDVNIETHDHLIVNTEALDYGVRSEVATIKTPLTFERENVRGRADAATVDAKSKKLRLNGGVEITVEPSGAGQVAGARLNSRDRPVTIKSARADFDQAARSLIFSGGATAEQERDIMSGDVLSGMLTEQKRLRQITARGNSYLRSMAEGRAAEVHAVDMDFFFDANQQLQRAAATRDVRARTLSADAEVQLTTGGGLEVDFAAQGERSVLKEMRAGARPVVMLAAPRSRASDPKAANKRLTADDIKLSWRTTGRDLERAEAVGQAELLIEPVQSTPQVDRQTLHAPRFDCEFYEADNLARVFTATGGARAVIEPVQPSEKRAARTLTAQKITAAFARETQDAERLDAQGDAKFNERDRNGQASNVSYTAADAMARMRGGEPVVWDSRARMKAAEIDTDTRKQISYGRGGVATTYYSQEQTGGATPFAKVKSPVFIASAAAEFRHEAQIGIYTGDARAWQDDNFVKGERITLYGETKRLESEGNVESALYQARRKDAQGNRIVVPVFATSTRMFYSDDERRLRYEGAVDIKQGTERITGEVADVYMLKDVYEVERTIAQRNVVLTQPGKRGTGDWAQYTAADETMVLTGSPARVEDTAQGSSESRRLTVYLRENRVVSDGGDGEQNTGRVRSTHKIKKQ